MASQLEKLRAENLRLTEENRRLRERFDGARKCLRALRNLTENWAYGPAFKKAGVMWPDGKCNAPAFVEANRWLKNDNDQNDD